MLSSAAEFFAVLPIVAVALFALNNAVFKHAFPGFFTGKLSDVSFCFFMPLFLSAVLAKLSRLGARKRVQIGITVTAVKGPLRV